MNLPNHSAEMLPLIKIKTMSEHPTYYSPDSYEVWDVADAWGLDKCAYLFNVLKYIARAGKKSKDTELEDLKKARNYLNRKIDQLDGNQ